MVANFVMKEKQSDLRYIPHSSGVILLFTLSFKTPTWGVGAGGVLLSDIPQFKKIFDLYKLR